MQFFRRIARWLRYAGADPVRLDHLSDELERGIAGQRPHLPVHKRRHDLIGEARDADLTA